MDMGISEVRRWLESTIDQCLRQATANMEKTLVALSQQINDIEERVLLMDGKLESLAATVRSIAKRKPKPPWGPEPHVLRQICIELGMSHPRSLLMSSEEELFHWIVSVAKLANVPTDKLPGNREK